MNVAYCVPGTAIQQGCYGSGGPQLYDHGFVASPSYPAKYYMDADCYWRLAVQKRQTIRVTLLDFELDVKVHDYGKNCQQSADCVTLRLWPSIAKLKSKLLLDYNNNKILYIPVIKMKVYARD